MLGRYSCLHEMDFAAFSCCVPIVAWLGAGLPVVLAQPAGAGPSPQQHRVLLHAGISQSAFNAAVVLVEININITQWVCHKPNVV